MQMITWAHPQPDFLLADLSPSTAFQLRFCELASLRDLLWGSCSAQVGALLLPEGSSFPQVEQREEDVRVLSDAVGGETLQVDQQVVWYRNATGFSVSLTACIALATKEKASISNKERANSTL